MTARPNDPRDIAVKSKTCRCGQPVRAPKQRYCASCHAAYQRSWRKSRSAKIATLIAAARAVAA